MITYFLEIVNPAINEALQKALIGRKIKAPTPDGEREFIVKDCRYGEDDGDQWIHVITSDGTIEDIWDEGHIYWEYIDHG